MSTSSFTEKHVGTIALIVSIIALFGTLVPQITDFVALPPRLKAPPLAALAAECPALAAPAGLAECPAWAAPAAAAWAASAASAP